MSKSIKIAITFALAAFGPACTSLGPQTIRSDRFNYNQAGAESAKEQMLLNIVRLRYGEPLYFLEVGSMLSQFKIEGGGNISGFHNNLHGSFGPAVRAAVGITNERPTNQTDAGGNIAYSDSPTITYRPLQGEEFSRRVMSPIPPSVIIFLAHSGWSVSRLFGCCVQQVNGISNHLLNDTESPEPDTKDFSRMLILMNKLQDARRGAFALEMENGAPITVLYIPETAPGMENELSELRKLLGYPAEGKLRLRVTGNAVRVAPDELAIETRSVLAAMYALAQECAAPASHIENHEVCADRSDPNADPATSLLRIEHSRLPHVDPFVQVFFNGYWFYIPKSDWSSKRTFALLTYLFSLQAADLSGAAGPVVTVGAGR